MSEGTDWHQIAKLYEQLELLTGSPIVRLNRAVAVGEDAGAAAGLELLNSIEAKLGGSHRFHSVRADLARRTGDMALARSSYEEALRLCSNHAETEFLTDRLASLT